jgi:ABC-type branched-subunit amino acid transport system substrate-binding protein
VNGRPVVIVSADSAGDPEIAVQEARRLVNDEDVDAIIEAGGFVATEVAQQVTDPAKVVLVASVPGEPPQGGAGQLELTPEASATSPPDDAPAAAKGPGFLFKTLVSPIAEQYAAGALIAQAGLTTACFVYSPEFIIDESGVEPRTEKREYDALRAAAPGVSWTEVEHQQPDTNVAQSPAAAATGAPTLDEAIALADEQARLELEQCGASEAVVLEVDWEEYPNAAGVSPPSIVRSSALQAAVTSDFQLVLTTSTLLGSIVYLDGTSVSILDNLDLTNVTNFHVLAAGAFDAARGKQFDDTFFGRFGDETAATTSSGLPDLPLAQLRSVYDAVYLIALAAEQADSRGGEALRDALLSVANSPGVDPVSDEPNLAAGRFRQGAELIARGQEIDFEGAAGPVQFDVNGNNVQGAVYVLSANVQGELIATDALIVDVTSGTVSAPRGRVITSDSFAIGVSFDAPAGFSVATDRTNDFAIERRRADAGRDAYIVFTRPQTVQGATEGELVPAPADFIAWLVAHPKIQLLSEVIDVTIGGRPARQVDITSDVGTHLFTIDEMSRFILVPSEIARVLAIDVDGQQMLILTGAILPFDVPESSGAAVEMAAFEELLPELEEMIASVRFE